MQVLDVLYVHLRHPCDSWQYLDKHSEHADNSNYHISVTTITSNHRMGGEAQLA